MQSITTVVLLFIIIAIKYQGILSLEKLPDCPEDFEDASDFCYVLSFPCPYLNILPFDSYKDLALNISESMEIRMPVVKKFAYNKICFLWETYDNYMLEFDLPIENDTENNNCLKLYKAKFIAYECYSDYEIPQMCAYPKLDQWKNPLCGEHCHQISISPYSECICVEFQNLDEYPKAEFIEPYQNQVYKLLTNETCNIGLQRSSTGFEWMNSKKELVYDFWAPEVNLSSDLSNVVASPEGWKLWNKSASCSFVKRKLISAPPKLELRIIYNSLGNVDRLLLNISNPNGLRENIFCYVGYPPDIFYYRYPEIMITNNYSEILYYFTPLNQFDFSIYECTGFSYHFSRQETSNSVYVRKIEHIVDYCLKGLDLNCFVLGGIRSETLCLQTGNEPQWKNNFENCEVLKTSSVTDHLIENLSNTKPDEIFIILENDATNFSVSDVYVTLKVLDKLGCSYLNETLIDMILGVSSEVLEESQIKLRTIDKGMDLVKYCLIKNEWNNETRINENYNEIDFNFNYDISELIRFIEPLNSNRTVLIGDSCLSTILGQRNFLPDNSVYTSKSMKEIIGVICYNETDSVSILQRFDFEIFDEIPVCAFWDNNNGRKGSWTIQGKAECKKSWCMCDFPHPGYFSFAFDSVLEDLPHSDAYSTEKLSQLENTSTQSYEMTEENVYKTSENSDDINSNISSDLENLLHSDASPNEKLRQLQNVSKQSNEMTEEEVYKVSEILKDISRGSKLDLNALGEVLSNLQNIKKGVFSNTQINTSSTDSIVFYTDEIIKNNSNKTNISIQKKNFYIEVHDVNASQFFGLILFQNNSLKILQKETKKEDLIKIENLESALIISPNLRQQLNETSKTKVIINIFFKNVLFNERSGEDAKNVSIIFDVILQDLAKMNGPLLIYHKIKKYKSKCDCAHWNFDIFEHIPGFWDNHNEGKKFSNLIECKYRHTTHFALILSSENYWSNSHFGLNMLSYVACGFSVFGFITICFTAILFKRWRIKKGTKILLQFSFSQFLLMFYCLSDSIYNSDKEICKFYGLFLHYIVLVQFCWMLLFAVLQYRRFVEILKVDWTHLVMICSMIVWLLPLTVVAACAVLFPESYVSKTGLCYPSEESFRFGILTFSGVVLTIVICIYFYIYYTIHKKNIHLSRNIKQKYKLRNLIFLFFTLSLHWVFALLVNYTGCIVFAYLFSFLAGAQGFIFCIFFIFCNREVRQMYLNQMKIKS